MLSRIFQIAANKMFNKNRRKSCAVNTLLDVMLSWIVEEDFLKQA